MIWEWKYWSGKNSNRKNAKGFSGFLHGILKVFILFLMVKEDWEKKYHKMNSAQKKKNVFTNSLTPIFTPSVLTLIMQSVSIFAR